MPGRLKFKRISLVLSQYTEWTRKRDHGKRGGEQIQCLNPLPLKTEIQTRDRMGQEFTQWVHPTILSPNLLKMLKFPLYCCGTLSWHFHCPFYDPTIYFLSGCSQFQPHQHIYGILKTLVWVYITYFSYAFVHLKSSLGPQMIGSKYFDILV